jgi:hypothetical protein
MKSKVLYSSHPETPDEELSVPIRKGEIFRHGKEIKGLRGCVLPYAAQGILKIDEARAEKSSFRMETV